VALGQAGQRAQNRLQGLLGRAKPTELLAGCPPELLGAEAPRYLEASKLTANVLRRDRLLPTPPRTFDCAKSAGLKPTQ